MSLIRNFCGIAHLNDKTITISYARLYHSLSHWPLVYDYFSIGLQFFLSVSLVCLIYNGKTTSMIAGIERIGITGCFIEL